jgi:outer membrane biosynthesis protein TonB
MYNKLLGIMKYIARLITIIIVGLYLTGCTETGKVTQKTTPPPQDTLIVVQEGTTKKTDLEITLIPEKKPAEPQQEALPEPQETVPPSPLPVLDEKPIQETQKVVSGKYMIQVGALNTEAAAQKKAELAKARFKKDCTITKNPVNQLYVVRFNKIFDNKLDAEAIRAQIVLDKDFADAWIVTINE